MSEVITDLRKRRILQKKRIVKALKARRAGITGGPVNSVENHARASLAHCEEMIRFYK